MRFLHFLFIFCLKRKKRQGLFALSLFFIILSFFGQNLANIIKNRTHTPLVMEKTSYSCGVQAIFARCEYTQPQ